MSYDLLSMLIMSTSVFHLFKGTEESVSECPICEDVFTEHNELMKHLSSHTKKQSFSEKTEDNIDVDPYQLAQTLTLQTKQFSICCPICDTIFTDHHDLKLHLNSHSKEASIPSSTHSFLVKEPSELRQHHAQSNEKELLPCPKYISVFNEPTELKKHILTHTNKVSLLSQNSNSDVKKHAELRQQHSDKELLLCPICNLVFINPEELKMHLMMHAESVSISCPICDAILIKPTELKLHLMSHADKVSISCPICEQVFQEPTELKLHLLVHPGKVLLPCTICDFKFKEPTKLRAHLTVHAEKLAISCPICDVGFIKPIELKMHLMIHADKVSCSSNNAVFTKDNQLKSICNINPVPPSSSKVAITEQTELDRNINSITDNKTSSSKNQLRCEICNHTYEHNLELKKHLYCHFKDKFLCTYCNVKYCDVELIDLHNPTNNTGLTYSKCPVCGKKLINEWRRENLQDSNLNARTSSLGTLGNPSQDYKRESFKCNICGFSFLIKFELNRHLYVHLTNLTCTFCNSRFPDVESLNLHYIHIHKVKKKLVCPICGKKLKNRWYFKEHLESCKSFSTKSHPKEAKVRTFKCANCNQVFTNKQRLLCHMDSHTNERPFECKYCKKRYKKKCDMSRCVMEHEGIKPFKCTSCPTSFVTSYKLKLHMLTHSEKSFKCSLCNHAYYRLCDLKYHFKKLHTDSGKKFICDKCGYASLYKKHLENHMLSNHLNEGSYKCGVCSASFDSQKSLSMHMARPNAHIKCSFCNVVFLSEKVLQSHVCISAQSENEISIQTSKSLFEIVASL